MGIPGGPYSRAPDEGVAPNAASSAGRDSGTCSSGSRVHTLAPRLKVCRIVSAWQLTLHWRAVVQNQLTLQRCAPQSSPAAPASHPRSRRCPPTRRSAPAGSWGHVDDKLAGPMCKPVGRRRHEEHRPPSTRARRQVDSPDADMVARHDVTHTSGSATARRLQGTANCSAAAKCCRVTRSCAPSSRCCRTSTGSCHRHAPDVNT